ncbi:MAG: PQQ-like beta-propeller repeat protein [Myxococcales bacterium]|nr:PQQ-like beta-propeller repeat protein [Myxococcales bacterium]
MIPYGLRRLCGVVATCTLGVAPLLALFGCGDDFPAVPDTGPDYADLFAPEDDGPNDLGAPDVGPDDVGDGPTNVCSAAWTYQVPESGAATHPIVDGDGIVTLTAGTSLRRIDLDGNDAAVCASPYVAPGQVLGSPSMNTTGTVYVGSVQGVVHAVTKSCKTKWAISPVPRASACEQTGKPIFCDGGAKPITEAPALLGNAIFALDETPALYRLNDLGTQAEFVWSFLTGDSESVPDAAPVISGETDPFVAFPTRRTVAAVNGNGAKRWLFELPEGKEITSPLAVTASGDLLFAMGTPAGGGFYTELEIGKILAVSPDKAGRMAAGFPRALNVTLDAVRGIAIAPDESLVMAMAGNGIIRLAPDSSQLWKFIGGAESLRATSVPTIADDGSTFVTAEPRSVIGVGLHGEQIFRYEVPGGGILDTTSPLIADDGTVLVYFGSQVRAYRCSETKGLAVSSWPRYQRNNRSSGQLQEPK